MSIYGQRYCTEMDKIIKFLPYIGPKNDGIYSYLTPSEIGDIRKYTNKYVSLHISPRDSLESSHNYLYLIIILHNSNSREYKYIKKKVGPFKVPIKLLKQACECNDPGSQLLFLNLFEQEVNKKVCTILKKRQLQQKSSSLSSLKKKK